MWTGKARIGTSNVPYHYVFSLPLVPWEVLGVKKLLEVLVMVIDVGCARHLLEGEAVIAAFRRPPDEVKTHVNLRSCPQGAVLRLHSRILNRFEGHPLEELLANRRDHLPFLVRILRLLKPTNGPLPHRFGVERPIDVRRHAAVEIAHHRVVMQLKPALDLGVRWFQLV